jgi:hypothetical protein
MFMGPANLLNKRAIIALAASSMWMKSRRCVPDVHLAGLPAKSESITVGTRRDRVSKGPYGKNRRAQAKLTS